MIQSGSLCKGKQSVSHLLCECAAAVHGGKGGGGVSAVHAAIGAQTETSQSARQCPTFLLSGVFSQPNCVPPLRAQQGAMVTIKLAAARLALRSGCMRDAAQKDVCSNCHSSKRGLQLYCPSNTHRRLTGR